MNGAVLIDVIFEVHSHFLRGCGQNAMVIFDRIAVSFEVNHVMQKGDLLFMMADRVCGVLKVSLPPSYGL